MISLDEVKHLAKLAYLSIERDNLKKLQHDLQRVLAYVQVLTQAATTKAPISHITGLTNITRPDTPSSGKASLSQELITAFPLKRGRWLKVSKVIDKDAL